MKPGRDDKAARVDRVTAAYRFRRDDGDTSVEESDVADGIESRSRIHHASAKNHAVINSVRGVLRRERGVREGGQQSKGCEPHAVSRGATTGLSLPERLSDR